MNLDDYVDVAERISKFYEKFPEGRLCEHGDPYVMTLGDGRQYVVYRARAYRTAEDPYPAPGSAWEPWPGPTQFTRDSELMNAETAAIGRAIVNVGIPSKKVASREEVKARQAPAQPVRTGYVEWLRLAIQQRDANQLNDDAEWAKLIASAKTPDDKKQVVATLEEALTTAGGDPSLVRARWEEQNRVAVAA